MILSLVGCVSNQPSQYEIWAEQPTPKYWDLESVWAFSLLEGDGQIGSVLTVRFTSLPANTCSGDDARILEIIHNEPPLHPAFLGEPAYWLDGRSLIIDLTSNICDAYTELRGELTDTGFVGSQHVGGMLGGKEIGPVYGVRIPDLD